jgi:anti-sigma regulatory factor (Ser/Thr protein kinase)
VPGKAAFRQARYRGYVHPHAEVGRARVGTLTAVEARSTFAPVPESAADARAFIERTLQNWRCDEHVDTARLLVSELVTNVVVHAGTDATVCIALDRDRLRIEVTDGCGEPPRSRQIVPDDLSGRGIPIVEALGDAWGVDPRTGGKTVWAEIRIR